MITAPAKEDNIASFKKPEADLRDGFSDTAMKAGRNVRGMLNSASDEIAYVSDKATVEIRANPIRSSAIALGVGMLLGALLRR